MFLRLGVRDMADKKESVTFDTGRYLKPRHGVSFPHPTKMSFVSGSFNLLRSRHEKCCTPQGVCLKEGQEAHRLGGHMSKGYESLKGIMQKTLHHSKPNPMAIARVKDSTASSLNDDMEELERDLADLPRWTATSRKPPESEKVVPPRAGR